MKDYKLKCDCAAKETLYVGDFDDGQVFLAIGEGRKKHYLPEVIIDPYKLIDILDKIIKSQEVNK